MKLYFENVGKLKHGEVDLNGITVICGDNNTGKSTVGKLLFCVFNSNYKIEETIAMQFFSKLLDDVNDIISKRLRDKMLQFGLVKPFKCEAEEFAEFCVSLPEDKEGSLVLIDSFFREHLKDAYYNNIDNVVELDEEAYALIKSTLELKPQDYKASRVKNFFNAVLGKQVINVRSNTAKISATIKGKTFDVNFGNQEMSGDNPDFEITNKAIFIDSPDKYKEYISDWDFRKKDMESNSLYTLVNELLDMEYADNSDVYRITIEERLNKIDNIFGNVIKGRFTKSDENIGGFQFDELDYPIYISNLSTGIKSLLLLRTLFETGKISERDVLILDEPEIHLHPDWQKIYAQIIVLLQREFNLTVLITSHSPAFVRAIECYCDYYDVMSDLDVYRTKRINDFECTLENLSYREYGVSELYDDFSRVFSELDDMLDRKYSDEESE